MARLRLGTRGPIPRTIAERIADKLIVDDNGCHVWQGSLSVSGYPQVQAGSTVDGTRRPQRAHRLLYEELYGSTDLDIHHVCENKRCLNPEHLEALEHGEHARRHSRNRPSTLAALQAGRDRWHREQGHG